MTEGQWTIAISLLTWLIMLGAYLGARHRLMHIPVMVALMIFDLVMPFYLYATRDFYDRLIVDGDILTFGIWMHFMLILVLYVLYGFQIATARQLLTGNDREGKARHEHHNQAKAILLTRAFVIFTGALLYEP